MTDPLVARSLRPQHGEALNGYLLNLATRLDITPAALISHAAIGSRQRTAPWRMVLTLTEGQAAAVGRTTGLAVEEVHHLTIAGHWRDLLWPAAYDLNDPSAARDAWIRLGSTNYCPDCLAEDPDYPGWKLSWITPWTFACTRHEVMLVDRCTTCDAAVGTRGDTRRITTWPLQPSVAAHAATCRSTTSDGSICGHDLRNAAASPLDVADSHDRALLDLQRRLDDILDRIALTETSIEQEVHAAQWLRDLRCLITLQLCADEPTVTAPMDQRCADAVFDYASARAKRRADRHGTWIDQVNTVPPTDPWLLAGLIREADELLNGADPEMRIRSSTAAASTNGSRWLSYRAALNPSPGLHRLLSPKVHGRLSVATLRVNSELPHIPSSVVPAYLPEPYLTPRLLSLPTTTATVRRAIPLVLHQIATGATLDQTSIALGYTEQAGQAAITRAGRAIERVEAGPVYTDIIDIAVELGAQRIDYAQRRAWFHQDWRIPADQWRDLLGELRKSRAWRADSDTPGRRDAVSLWIWSEVVGGDPGFSPMFTTHTGHTTTTNGTVQALTTLRRKSGPAVAQALNDIAADLARRIDAGTAPAKDHRPCVIAHLASLTSPVPSSPEVTAP